MLADLAPAVASKARAFLEELGDATLVLSHGFGDRAAADSEQIMATYAEGRPLDRERGFTRFGAHRADWTLSFAGAPRREYL